MPRTGTLTQKVALEQLGLTPCYHWVNVLADLDSVPVWDGAMDGEQPWQQLFGDSRATVDWPGGYFYAELMEAYPQAKVLLSVRDPEPWARSFADTIVEMCHGETVMPLLARARAQIDPRWKSYMALVDRMFWGPQGTFKDGYERPEQLIEQMERHHAEVKRVVAPERLLVWDVTEGWEPLCAFLEVDVPQEPMPHANDRGTFVERVIGGAMEALRGWQEETVGAA